MPGMMRWAILGLLAMAFAGCSDGGGGGNDDGDGPGDGPIVASGINETIPLIDYPIERITEDTSLGFTFTDDNAVVVRLQADSGLELEGASYTGDDTIGWGFMLLDVELDPDVSDPCRPVEGEFFHSGFGVEMQAERGTGYYDLWIWGDGAVTLDFNGEAEAPTEPIVYRSAWSFTVTTEEVAVEGPPASAAFEMGLQATAPGLVLARFEPPNGIGVEAQASLTVSASAGDCATGAPVDDGGGFGGGDALLASAVVPAGSITVTGEYSETGHSLQGGEAKVLLLTPA